MINITVTGSGSELKRLDFAGHAGYDDYGKDIVCAAVSVLFINTVNSIESFTGDEIQVTNDSHGVTVDFRDSPSGGTILLVKSLLLGIREIINTYGDTYVSLVEEE